MLVDAVARLAHKTVRARAVADALLHERVVAHMQLEARVAELTAAGRVVLRTETGVAFSNKRQLLFESPVGRERHLSENGALEAVSECASVAVRTPVDQEPRADVQMLTSRTLLLTLSSLVRHTETRKPKHVHLQIKRSEDLSEALSAITIMQFKRDNNFNYPN